MSEDRSRLTQSSQALPVSSSVAATPPPGGEEFLFQYRRTSSLPHHYKTNLAEADHAKWNQLAAKHRHNSQGNLNSSPGRVSNGGHVSPQDNGGEVAPPRYPLQSRVNPIELKKRLSLMRQWFSEFTLPQRTLALANIRVSK